MEHQHVKVLDDTSSKNRLRFASSRKRSLSATANVYRNVKRQAGTTASGREALVHHGTVEGDSSATSFSEELDIAMDRNPSEIFFHFHRQVWPLVRSLPELLHHSKQVLDLLLSYLLSPEDAPGACSDLSEEASNNSARKRYVTNLATPDILHLLGVFAKDLRHEIHGFIHSKILPRLVYDLLSPPPQPNVQQTPLDVGFIEATFRNMSYIFKYDAQMLLAETDPKKPSESPCLEPMRRYYGVTLAHKRDLVRRLAAEAFAPLVRKSPQRSKHLKRVLRALAASQSSGRMLSDAVDGIGQLLIEVTRGSTGKLHSKGIVAIQVLLDVMTGKLSESGSDCVLNVGLRLYSGLRNFLDDSNLHEALNLLIDAAAKSVRKGDESSRLLLRLVTKVVAECRLSRTQCQSIVEPIRKVASEALGKDDSKEITQMETAAIDLVVTLWTALPDDDEVAIVLSPLLDRFWIYAMAKPSDSVVSRLIHTLIPNLKIELAMSTLGSKMICHAASNPNSEGVLELLHSLASIPSAMNQDSDDLYSIEHASFCEVPTHSKDVLLDEFTRIDFFGDDQTLLARLKVASFLAAIKVTNRTISRGHFHQVASFLEWILRSRFDGPKGCLDDKGVLLAAVALEALARVMHFSLNEGFDASSVVDVVRKVRPHAQRLLKTYPTSILVLKSAAMMIEVFLRVHCEYAEKHETDELFEILSPNLCHRNHFMRRHSLLILKSFPKLPYVLDHAELDLQGDLDEEADSTPIMRDGVMLSGLCDVLEKLHEIETTSPDLSNERHLCFLLHSTGVIIERLPMLYIEAVGNHLLGILSIRFAPLWSASLKAFSALAMRHPETCWPILHGQLQDFVGIMAPSIGTEESSLHPSKHILDFREAFVHQLTLNAWPSYDHPSFGPRISASQNDGQVSKFRATDRLAVVEHLWKAAENSPTLLCAKGSDISSFVIRFMEEQYYTGGNKEDPDAREMKLAAHVMNKGSANEERSQRKANDAHRYLIFMLKAFAALNQPRQLKKSDILLMIFTSLVGNWDCEVATLAFKCVMRFRLPYVSPYSELLMQLFEKKGFRDALLKLREASVAGTILSDHRRDLAPILWRIVFGRLSAKSSASKSSKDSPSARRNAAMSCMSSFCQTDEEIYPLIYLVVRRYIPSNVEVQPLEKQDKDHKEHIMNNLLRQNEAPDVPIQIHQGFLNNLEAVLANLQSKLSPYISVLLFLTLSITKAFEVSGESTTIKGSDVLLADSKNGSSSIRSLCYRRLSDIYASFADLVVHQTDYLMESIQNSIPLLPSMAADSEKPPALLMLFRALVEQPRIYPKLAANQQYTQCLLQCFSVRSKPSVTTVVLDIVEVMVGEQAGLLSSTNVALLLNQFELRLNNSVNDNPSWRRELEILLQLCALVRENDEISTSRNAHSICRVLVPFLHTRANSDDKHRVVGVLRHLAVLVPADEAWDIFKLISCVFALHKNRPILAEVDLRSIVAQTLQEISEKFVPKARKASDVLVQLCSIEPRKMDEINLNAVIEILSVLGDSNSDANWENLYTFGGEVDLGLVEPIVGCCFCFLLHTDGVVTRTSFKSLIKLISSLSRNRVSEDPLPIWNKFLESYIVPTIRCGLTYRQESARSHFISLMRCVVKSNTPLESIHLHTDLSDLVRDDQDDLDFFVNIRHVQIHRRARALQRLRKSVNAVDAGTYSPTSVVSVLLPLAIHPVYESQSKSEEAFALEGIATAGSLARLLPWNKYNSLLWTHLTQFERHPKQEKYLIGLICALIEAFGFDVGIEVQTCAVARGLNKRIIPKVESLLTKNIDRKGTFLRPTVAIALLRLFQKLPPEEFPAKLNRLLKTICNELRNKDSNSRDIARNALAKIVSLLDMKYLADVVRELAFSLNEGYKLHVRTAALHTILSEMIKNDEERLLSEEEKNSFHGTIPGILDLIQRDLFDEAQDRREARGSSRVKYVKEAQGSKAVHCLEILASLVHTGHNAYQTCATMQMLVAPFLERLRDPNLIAGVVGKVKDSMVRLSTGFLKNQKITRDDMMTFVRATLVDFISESDLHMLLNFKDDDEVEEDGEVLKPITVSGSVTATKEESHSQRSMVVEWRPNTLRNVETVKDANERKKLEERKRSKVIDGASAPKMTGSMRRVTPSSRGTIADNLKTRIAVVFCLNLLSPTLKSVSIKQEEHATLDNFVPVLTACACCCRDTEVVLLSFRCLSGLVRLKLPKMVQCSSAIATKSLDLLTSSSGNQEQLQAAFKMLTQLVSVDDQSVSLSALPIEADHMPVLISFLRESIISGDQCSQALGLLKSILRHRFISVELYDLMDMVLEQTVRSSKEPIRSQCSNVFATFLVNYPLPPSKVDCYLKLVVANVSYDFEQGRLSAIALVSLLVDRLPEVFLDERSSIFFIPLCLQLANEDVPECCNALQSCVGNFLKRMKQETLQTLFEYVRKWSIQESETLRNISVLVFRIFSKQRPDFIKRQSRDTILVETLVTMLEDNSHNADLLVLSLGLFADLCVSCRCTVNSNFALWNALLKIWTRDNPEIRLKSCRILDQHMASIKPDGFLQSETATFLSQQGVLFQVGRALCFLIDKNPEHDCAELTTLVVKLLTWTLQAMHAYPNLCSNTDATSENDPVYWVMKRLSSIAKHKGMKRQSVYKCFAAFAVHCASFCFVHLELMLEPLCRSETELKNEPEKLMYRGFQPNLLGEGEPSTEALLVKDVMNLLEEKCPDESLFLGALANVRTRALEKKEKRKVEQKTEAVTNPQVFFQKKIAKQQREKGRRKRKIDNFRSDRGSSAKRKYV